MKSIILIPLLLISACASEQQKTEVITKYVIQYPKITMPERPVLTVSKDTDTDGEAARNIENNEYKLMGYAKKLENLLESISTSSDNP